MDWIVNWFQESEWQRRRQDWARYGVYKPPTIDQTFILLYKYDDEGSRVFCALDPYVSTNAQDIRAQKQWKQNQGGVPSYGSGYMYGLRGGGRIYVDSRPSEIIILPATGRTTTQTQIDNDFWPTLTGPYP
ncbi:hypothetical protein K458DRAFT_396103 [Lentithecium fluviatile CBS 122367]|uniref:Uncharacterized protein n=1 Tax=Lentithecium fluviatile CBS 122367 TaxID=1168545 RepID=A0A6G1IG54_9PLEO|nr:hypothetical protein K458DRAFT_396103 [Lentithecium fluviatile CBS 122367]